MAEQEAHDSETLVKDEKEEVPDIESQVKVAMRSRVGHFKDQADSLTFEGVRRLLEKDMGLETYALDVHKRFIKQLLQELLEEANDANDSKHEETEEKGNYEETGEKGVAGDEEANSPEGHQPNKDVKESFSKDEEKMGDSPVLGLLTGNKTTESKTKESKGVNEKKAPNKSMIKTAIRKRTQYLKANLENLSIRDLRRLLEKDLKLDMYSLDPYKKFIGDQVDEVLSSSEVSKPAPTVKKNVGKNNSQRKVAKKVISEENSDSLGDESEEEEEVRPRKKTVRKGNMDSNGSKRKRPAKDTKISGKKRVKPATEDNSDEEDNGNVSEDGQSQSSAEKSTKKKVVSTPAYGKRVENLKSIIKACGMSVPPSVYKKVKQVPENKREAQLIKELEEILSKEGLSANPSEKEIKECKKRKERARELEGIDTSNIVSSSRRRSTSSFVAPPKPEIPVEKDADDGEGTEDDGNDDDDEEDEEDNGNSAESQSEESNEDDDDDENSD